MGRFSPWPLQTVSTWPLLPAPQLCPHVPRGCWTCVVMRAQCHQTEGDLWSWRPFEALGCPQGPPYWLGGGGVDRWGNQGPKSGIAVASRGLPPRIPSCSSLFSASWPVMGVFMAAAEPEQPGADGGRLMGPLPAPPPPGHPLGTVRLRVPCPDFRSTSPLASWVTWVCCLPRSLLL